MKKTALILSMIFSINFANANMPAGGSPENAALGTSTSSNVSGFLFYMFSKKAETKNDKVKKDNKE